MTVLTKHNANEFSVFQNMISLFVVAYPIDGHNYLPTHVQDACFVKLNPPYIKELAQGIVSDGIRFHMYCSRGIMSMQWSHSSHSVGIYCMIFPRVGTYPDVSGNRNLVAAN